MKRAERGGGSGGGRGAPFSVSSSSSFSTKAGEIKRGKRRGSPPSSLLQCGQTLAAYSRLTGAVFSPPQRFDLGDLFWIFRRLLRLFAAEAPFLSCERGTEEGPWKGGNDERAQNRQGERVLPSTHGQATKQ